MLKEIGGYMDFERFHGPMLHEDGIKLNCGRNCLAYLIEARGIEKLLMPYWMCDSVFDVCCEHNVALRFYHVSLEMKPLIDGLEDGEWLYLMNYYGQLTDEEIREYARRYGRVILDNTQAYFDAPIKGVDTLYTCRKFFGVADGAILCSDVRRPDTLERETACDHMAHLLGRFEQGASTYYAQSIENNRRFRGAPIRDMSALTENLLHGIDYNVVKDLRTANYRRLHEAFQGINQLEPRLVEGAFAYPLMLENGAEIRKRLIARKIFVPILWPNVICAMPSAEADASMASNILPLPCDQRYKQEDMDYIIGSVLKHLGKD